MGRVFVLLFEVVEAERWHFGACTWLCSLSKVAFLLVSFGWNAWIRPRCLWYGVCIALSHYLSLWRDREQVGSIWRRHGLAGVGRGGGREESGGGRVQWLGALGSHAPPAARNATAPRVACPLPFLIRDDLASLMLLLLSLQLREAWLLCARLLLPSSSILRRHYIRGGSGKTVGDLGRLGLSPRLMEALVRQVLANALEAVLVLGRRYLRTTNRERHRLCGFSVVRWDRGRVLLVLRRISRCILVDVAVLVVSASMLKRLSHVGLMIAEDVVFLELLDATIALITPYCPLRAHLGVVRHAALDLVQMVSLHLLVGLVRGGQAWRGDVLLV